jgi:hypothetical protein
MHFAGAFLRVCHWQERSDEAFRRCAQRPCFGGGRVQRSASVQAPGAFRSSQDDGQKSFAPTAKKKQDKNVGYLKIKPDIYGVILTKIIF